MPHYHQFVATVSYWAPDESFSCFFGWISNKPLQLFDTTSARCKTAFKKLMPVLVCRVSNLTRSVFWCTRRSQVTAFYKPQTITLRRRTCGNLCYSRAKFMIRRFFRPSIEISQGMSTCARHCNKQQQRPWHLRPTISKRYKTMLTHGERVEMSRSESLTENGDRCG